jgi:D-hydroxyproline dehydrogenase subunit gamma
MADSIRIFVDGEPMEVAAGVTVAAAVASREDPTTRTSRGGDRRAPLCGMGVCFECRVEIDGAFNQRSCMIVCRADMQVRTGR